jgi:hypothetical protein
MSKLLCSETSKYQPNKTVESKLQKSKTNCLSNLTKGNHLFHYRITVETVQENTNPETKTGMTPNKTSKKTNPKFDFFTDYYPIKCFVINTGNKLSEPVKNMKIRN